MDNNPRNRKVIDYHPRGVDLSTTRIRLPKDLHEFYKGYCEKRKISFAKLVTELLIEHKSSLNIDQ